MSNEESDILAGGVDGLLDLPRKISHLFNYFNDEADMKASYSYQILLAVLLAHSDQFGVVSGLGLRGISNFSGLKKEVLRNRLDLLVAKRLIRAIVPGVTGGNVFIKRPSIYILNFSHPCFGASSGLISIVVQGPHNRRAEEYPARSMLSKSVKLNRARLSGRKLPSAAAFEKDALKVFDESFITRFEPMLQALIDRHASYFISNVGFIKDLDECGNTEIWADIKQQLIVDLRLGVFSDSAKAPVKSNPKKINEEYQSALQLDQHYRQERLLKLRALLLSEIRIWAFDIHRALTDLSFTKEVECSYFILPCSKMLVSGYSYLAILAKPKTASQFAGCYVHFQETKHYPVESDIPPEDLYLYGLLSRPKKRLGLATD